MLYGQWDRLLIDGFKHADNDDSSLLEPRSFPTFHTKTNVLCLLLTNFNYSFEKMNHVCRTFAKVDDMKYC